MQALGLIETRGLVAAVESADAMLKAAEVKLLEKTMVGGGLVSITVAGDVGAVKAAIEAGAAAVDQLNKNALVSQHVIPRPHESLEEIIILEKPLLDAENIPVSTSHRTSVRETNHLVENNVNIVVDLIEAENMNLAETDSKVEEQDTVQDDTSMEVHKEHLDEQIKTSGIEAAVKLLNDMNLRTLRKLANEYEDFAIKRESIARASKKWLLAEFKKYYGQNQHGEPE